MIVRIKYANEAMPAAYELTLNIEGSLMPTVADHAQSTTDAAAKLAIYHNDSLVLASSRPRREGKLVRRSFPVTLVEGENQAVPPPGAGLIYPMHWVGAPMWIRKGILTDLPGMTLNNECEQIHNYVLAKGFQEGLITGLRHLHLGHGFSSTPGLDFGY